MFVYEHDRTKDIVNRLVTIGNVIHVMTIAIFVIAAGLGFSLVGALVQQETWWMAAIIGVAVGCLLGRFVARLLTVALEWMAQLLVAQGEIVASLKENGA